MSKPKSITIDNIKYYNASELEEYDPVYFKGCRKTIRQIVEKKSINKDSIAYGNNNKRYGWRLSKNQTIPPPKANLLLKEGWVFKNIQKMNEGLDSDLESDGEEVPKRRSVSIKEKKVMKTKKIKKLNKSKLNDMPKVPDLLILKDEEKFHDDNGTIFDIETRGNRTYEGVFFLAKDVSAAFEMKTIIRGVKNRDSSYNEKEDYLFFYRISGKKQMYFTYEGMIKILYSSQSNKAKTFRKWATETLFTVQMGTGDQKQELAAGLIGVPAQTLKDVLSKSVSNISCVYRFVLGTCKDLRKVMKISHDIPDNHLIIKYGFTDNLIRRTNDHMKNYGAIKGARFEIMDFAYIDPMYISNAESEVKEFFEDIETFIEYKSHKELVAVNPKHNKQIKKFYKHVKDEFGGCVKELNDKIEELKRDCEKKDLEIENMRKIHSLELKEKENELVLKDRDNELIVKNKELALKDKDLILKEKDNENDILKKNLEIAELKYQLLMSKK